jgi:NtrC-family two-component system sensor histidine kinase KinB
MNDPQQGENSTARASLELLYHISREIAITLDLPTVLQRVLYLSMRTIGAVSGSIIVLDDNGNPVDSAIIHGGHVLDQTNEQLQKTLEKGLAGWVVRHRQAVLVPDTSRDERWLRRPDDEEQATGPKSAVSAPFVARDQLAGVVTLVHPEPHFFTIDHLALVQAIADQASVAVLNARLFADSQRQARVMTALAASAVSINASLKLEDVLAQILEQTSQALGVQVVSLALIEPKSKELKYCASTSKGKHNVVGKVLEIGQGIAGWVAKEGQGVIVLDAYHDPRFYPEIDRATGFRTQVIACAPVRSRGEIIGILEAINPSDRRFGSDALLVLNGIGSLAGTAIRHAQLFETLEATHERYHDLFENNVNCMLISDRKGCILEANQQTANLSGFDKETLRHMTISSLHKSETENLGILLDQLSSSETRSYDALLLAQSGGEIQVEVHVQITDGEGESLLQWIMNDIRPRRELDKLREELLSSIYHDLRSPLANVVSSMDVLANTLSLEHDPAIQSLFNIAVRSTERIQRLTNSLLDINRLEAGQPVTNIRPVAPHTLVEDALEAVLPIAKNKNQSVTTQIPENMPTVAVDIDMIKRVLINLLENAIKFTPPEGRIGVGARVDDEWVQLWVDDTGPGIPTEKQRNIFNKFTRLQEKGGPAGFGLGLAYCRLAVEGHGGRIWVENLLNSGAHFAFTLPAATDEKQELSGNSNGGS